MQQTAVQGPSLESYVNWEQWQKWLHWLIDSSLALVALCRSSPKPLSLPLLPLRDFSLCKMLQQQQFLLSYKRRFRHRAEKQVAQTSCVLSNTKGNHTYLAELRHRLIHITIITRPSSSLQKQARTRAENTSKCLLLKIRFCLQPSSVCSSGAAQAFSL